MPDEVETLAAIGTGTGNTGTPITLLSSMVFGREFSTLPNGKKTYMTTTGKLVCEHGEHASTICHWLMVEKRAWLENTPAPATTRRGPWAFVLRLRPHRGPQLQAE